jgi:CubicO group peptidase (beta-lactamase class C family)
MINRIKFLLLALVIIPLALSSQVIQLNPKANPEISYERLARIDTLVNYYVKNNWLKGAVVLIVKDNELIKYQGYGFADAETKTPMANNTIFRIMSQTKAIVSAGAMILYEQGKFMLDEPVSDFIPEYKNQKVLDKFNPVDSTYTTVSANRDITFRDLLTHTSGLDYPDIGGDEMGIIYARAKIPSGLGAFNENLLERMKALGKLPLAHQPGEKWTYGLNCDLLGCLIEVISGMNLEDYLRKNIFDPLGMNDSYFNVPEGKAKRLASVYTENSRNEIIKWSHTFRNIDPDYPMMHKHYFSGGAGLSSTAFDYAIFLQMMLNGGSYNGREILAPSTVELMTQNQIGELVLGRDKFGLGFEITSKEGAAIGPCSKGTFSWGGYFGTTYWADPEKKLVCLLMTQHTPNSHSELESKFKVLVYQALKK